MTTDREELRELAETVERLHRETVKIAELTKVLAAALASLNAIEQLGDDAQLANVDLQNILQKQQQTLQAMSNISKMLNDTAQSVIRKIGG